MQKAGSAPVWHSRAWCMLSAESLCLFVCFFFQHDNFLVTVKLGG